MTEQPDKFLRHLFDTAIGAVSAEQCLTTHLPKPPKGKTVVVGAGKAAAAMALTFESHWAGEFSGAVVVPYGHAVECKSIEILEARHPVPDEAGEEAARRILDMVSHLTADDLVVALLSGGGSALLTLPAAGITLEEKQTINQAFLRSGAPIAEINTVRCALSAIKGGRLANAARPARVATLIVSDVAGDNPAIVASGPTLPPTASEPVSDILDRYNIDIPENVRTVLSKNTTSFLHKDAFELDTVSIVARSSDVLNAAKAEAERQGWEAVTLGDDIEGEAKDVADEHARQALEAARFRNAESRPLVLLSGGEVTVTLGGSNGDGGPNSEYLLALGLALNRDPKIWALSADTDGIDGNSRNAGAILTPYSVSGAIEMGLDPTGLLTAHRSATLFEMLGHTIETGPTLTNVNDFRAIAICAGAY
ncbi:MAG: glycerate kinase [Rhodospirillaceae bacterium]|nr:glycerate kinase [Rhodospirillaceae bacterium]|tara:strand:- start:42261 stop:43529 length:1269 start_codon:yes stop_codon:yes gene_type:complete